MEDVGGVYGGRGAGDLRYEPDGPLQVGANAVEVLTEGAPAQQSELHRGTVREPLPLAGVVHRNDVRDCLSVASTRTSRVEPLRGATGSRVSLGLTSFSATVRLVPR